MKYKIVLEWRKASHLNEPIERYIALAERSNGKITKITKTIDRSSGLISYYGPRGGKIQASEIEELIAK
jgi:hypothetical protein